MNAVSREAPERQEIEALLPWHAAGTLSRRDRERVERAIASDSELARRLKPWFEAAGIWDDAFVPGLRRCVEFIRQHNSVPGIQLGHSGRKARASRPANPRGARSRADRRAQSGTRGWGG